MKSWDAIIIGGGIIGLSLAIALRKQGLNVLVVERGELGREASYAAAGMLAATGPEIPQALAPLAAESAELYPEFVHELEDESGVKIDFREHGTIRLLSNGRSSLDAKCLSVNELRSLEPELDLIITTGLRSSLESSAAHAQFVSERSVDPRSLMIALIKAAKHRGVDVSSGTEATGLRVEHGQATGVQTDRTSYSSGIVVNCAGAWAGQIGPGHFPIRPVKGQMLSVVGAPKLTHVIRADEVYLVPRSDGRIVIGSTLEEAGFNKQTDVNAIERLFQAATSLVPKLAKSRQHEAWAGLRPGTPDDLPVLGETATPGYFMATGHYRDGILLAPATAQALVRAIVGKKSGNLTTFSPARFW